MLDLEEETGDVDSDPDSNEETTFECSGEEVDRVPQLLARTPADRKWRRQCWLVMLRSRRTNDAAEMTAALRTKMAVVRKPTRG